MHARRTPELIIVGWAAVLLVGAVVGLSSPTGGGGPTETGTVEIEGTAFGPEARDGRGGATVTWTNFDGATHTVTQNGGAARLTGPGHR